MVFAIAAFAALLFVSLYARKVELELDQCERASQCECHIEER